MILRNMNKLKYFILGFFIAVILFIFVNSLQDLINILSTPISTPKSGGELLFTLPDPDKVEKEDQDCLTQSINIDINNKPLILGSIVILISIITITSHLLALQIENKILFDALLNTHQQLELQNFHIENISNMIDDIIKSQPYQ